MIPKSISIEYFLYLDFIPEFIFSNILIWDTFNDQLTLISFRNEFDIVGFIDFLIVSKPYTSDSNISDFTWEYCSVLDTDAEIWKLKYEKC